MLYSHCSVSQWVQHILVAKQKGNLDRHEKQDFAFCQSHGSLKGVTCRLTIIKLSMFYLCVLYSGKQQVISTNQNYLCCVLK